MNLTNLKVNAMKSIHVQRLFLMLLLPLVLLAVGCTGDSVVDPEPENRPTSTAFTITSRLNAPGAALALQSTGMAGRFEAFGFIEDQGLVQDFLNTSTSSLHGVRTLEGAKGALSIEYYAGLNPLGQDSMHAYGGFELVGTSGAYANLKGGGVIDQKIASSTPLDKITRVLSGEAYSVQ